jgi:hypothetical protein
LPWAGLPSGFGVSNAKFKALFSILTSRISVPAFQPPALLAGFPPVFIQVSDNFWEKRLVPIDLFFTPRNAPQVAPPTAAGLWIIK